MEDRELLELAAKAAGIEIFKWGKNEGAFLRDASAWSPLTNDGDALRLAVKVPGINLTWMLTEARSRFSSEDDRRAFVRRGIVLVAAQEGRAMS